MAFYITDTVRVTNSALSLDGVTPITPDMVTSATCQIWSTAASPATEIVAPADMSWDNVNNLFYYDWDTTNQVAGSYMAVVELTGAGATPWNKRDYIKITLRDDLVVSASPGPGV